MNPKVSVVMSVYNGEKYLKEAIDSILWQTFTDFEFVIIDDGSVDSSVQIIGSYRDDRIKLVCNNRNIGLTRSLNKGLEVSHGQYIARMDGDDISLPERLAKQVAFMNANTEVGVCGTWAKNIDCAGNVIGERLTPTGKELENDYWRPSPLIHPTVMIRVSHLKDLRYDEKLRYAQDFDLWLRMKSKHKLGNIAEHLLLYRMHDDSTTATKRDAQLHTSYDIFCKHTGAQKISYDAFLALNFCTYSVNPLRRILATIHLSKIIGRPYRNFLRNDLYYTRQWLKIRFLH